MKAVLGFREQLQKFYSVFGFYLRKILQFIMALIIFQAIGKALGYMPILTSSVILAGLALVCMLLPVSWTVFVSAVLILGHMYKVSLVVMGMTAVVLMLLYIFYLRFASMYSWVVLLTPIAIGMKLGFAVPVILALTGGPFAAFAAGVGIFCYYFLQFLEQYAATATSGSGIQDIISQATEFIRASFGNKEMWLMIVVFVAVTFAVYLVRRLPIPFAWEIALAAGVGACFLSNAIVGAKLGCTLGAGSIISGCIIMVIVGLILILCLHTVDYSETRKVQFEDDDYYYYVKAVPKLSIAAPHKEVKTFGANKSAQQPEETYEETYYPEDEEYYQENEGEYEEEYYEDEEEYYEDEEAYYEEDEDMQIIE